MTDIGFRGRNALFLQRRVIALKAQLAGGKIVSRTGNKGDAPVAAGNQEIDRIIGQVIIIVNHRVDKGLTAGFLLRDEHHGIFHIQHMAGQLMVDVDAREDETVNPVLGELVEQLHLTFGFAVGFAHDHRVALVLAHAVDTPGHRADDGV